VKTKADREKGGKICFCSVFHSFADDPLGTSVALKAPDSRCSDERIIIETHMTERSYEARLRETFVLG
jgi:hypothetical protein